MSTTVIITRIQARKRMSKVKHLSIILTGTELGARIIDGLCGEKLELHQQAL